VFLVAVALSTVALLIGPLIAGAARRHGWSRALVDAATLGLVPTIIVARLLPHVALESGAWAVGAFAVGFGLCVVVESYAHTDSTRLAEAVVLPPLAVHAFLDGAGLAIAFKSGGDSTAQATLAGALVFHKLPEGLFVGSTYVPTRGLRSAMLRACFLGAATIIGALAGRELLAHAPDATVHVALGFGLGAMLRLVTHSHERHELSPALAAASGMLFLASVAAVLVVPSPRRIFFSAQPHELSVSGALVPLFLETAPYALAALAIAAALRRTRSWACGIDMAAIAVALPILGVRAAALIAMAQTAIAWYARASTRDAAVLERRSYVLGVLVCVGAEAALPRDALAGSALLAGCVTLIVFTPWLRGAGATVCATLLVHKGAPATMVLPILLASFAWPFRHLPRLVFVVGIVVGISIAVRLHSPPLHAVGEHVHRSWEWAAAAGVVLLTAADILRAGPRGWLGVHESSFP